MAKSNGYGICITNEEFKIFVFSLKLKFNIDEETVNKYIEILKEFKLLLIIKDEETGEEYYTTLQSVWNYEYRLYYRYTNREKQKKSRQRKNKTDKVIEETPPIVSDDLPFVDNNDSSDDSSDFSEISFDDLPFDV